MTRRIPLMVLLLAAILATNPVEAKKKRVPQRGRNVPERPVIMPKPAGGLQSSLSTNGYQFTQVTPPPNHPIAAPTFRATASLLNQSRTDVPLAFVDRSIVARGWNFRLYDPNGILVWQSEAEDEEVPNAQPYTFALRPGRALSRTVTVPLWLESGPLEPGRYTVEAILLTDTPLVVTSFISVLSGKQPPVLMGTVKGLVLHGERDATGQMRPAPEMHVTITPKSQVRPPLPVSPVEINIPSGATNTNPGASGADNTPSIFRPSPISPPHLPPSWSGFTDDKGTFTANLLPGTYTVRAMPAYTIMIFPPPPLPTGSSEITIRAGETTETTVILKQPKIVGPPVVVDPAKE